MKDAVITLISETSAKNSYGVYVPTLTQKNVFCRVESVSRAEFFEGGRNGLNPQYKFILFPGDYSGERDVLYEGMPYAVYRTFDGKMDQLELYAERKGGTNAIGQTQTGVQTPKQEEPTQNGEQEGKTD